MYRGARILCKRGVAGGGGAGHPLYIHVWSTSPRPPSSRRRLEGGVDDLQLSGGGVARGSTWILYHTKKKRGGGLIDKTTHAPKS